ncbi:hypothetical protein ACS0TY_020721 [Phlomoides rotata]
MVVLEQIKLNLGVRVLKKDITRKIRRGTMLGSVVLFFWSSILDMVLSISLRTLCIRLERTHSDKHEIHLPFKPFDQLMGVLPPRSAHALPAAFKGLMCDEDSTIIDFYPSDVPTDVDGKRFLWQGICKLPFIDEERLLIETRRCEHELKEHEIIRNSHTLDRLFVRCSSEKLLCGGARTTSEKIKDAITMESRIDGIKGTLHMMMPEDLNGVNVERNDDSIKDFCMFYETLGGSQNVPCLLEGVNIPEKLALTSLNSLLRLLYPVSTGVTSPEPGAKLKIKDISNAYEDGN